MQHYLDNASSVQVASRTRNHGRELMELHTVGAQTLYAQADPETDVRDSARILTGLGVDDPSGCGRLSPGLALHRAR